MVSQFTNSLAPERKQALIAALQNLPYEWALTPVTGNKQPYRNNWQRKGMPYQQLIAEIRSDRAKGFGLLTGVLSGGILAIDCDGEAAHALLAKYGELPKTVAFTSGRPGRCQYLLQVGEEFWSVAKTTKLNSGIKGDDGKEQLLEFRWDGCQSVLPPSMHPLTEQYQWVVSPEESAIADCPMWVIELILNGEQDQPTLPPQPQQSHTRYEQITVPVPASVPLEVCLGKESRNLLNGVAEPGRNDAGAKLARDLIGTADYLRSIGQAFDGDPQSLFDGFASRCSPPLPAREASTIWKSAERSRPSPACKSDGVDNCVRAWYWNNHVRSHRQASSVRGNVVPLRVPDTMQISVEQAVEQARLILRETDNEIAANVRLESVRRACGMGDYSWSNNIVKPLKRELEGDRFKLELLGLLQMEDEVDRERLIAQLAPKYSMSAGRIERAMSKMKARTQTPETKVLDLDELFDLEVEALNWIVPGVLPSRETIVLAGSPKTGKTLLAFDLAFCVATGEDAFLGETAKQGKVLLVSTDESPASTRNKLLNRGFRKQDKDAIKIVPNWDISQMATLEKILEEFRPDITIIDSLRRINKGSEISENSAEFADNIYTLKETLSRYGSAGVLVHHTNKDREALGVDRLRGSSAIAGAVWGVWQLDQIPKPDPNNKKRMIIDPKDPKRMLSVFARDTEGQQLTIELNLENSSWHSLGSGESEEELSAKLTIRDRILKVLAANPSPMSGKAIIEALDGAEVAPNSVYNELSNMERKRLIGSKPAPGDKRYKVFSLPRTLQKFEANSLPPLPPTPSVQNMTNFAESHTEHGFEDSHVDSHVIVIPQTGTLLPEIAEAPTQSQAENSHIFSTGTRGGGVESKSEPPALTKVNNLAQSPEPSPEPTPAEQSPFKIGDRCLMTNTGDEVKVIGFTEEGKVKVKYLIESSASGMKNEAEVSPIWLKKCEPDPRGID